MFQEKLKHINWYTLEDTNVNEAYDLFWEMVWHAYFESFPLKRLSRSKAKNKKWLTIDLLNCIKKDIYCSVSTLLCQLMRGRKNTENIETYLIE